MSDSVDGEVPSSERLGVSFRGISSGHSERALMAGALIWALVPAHEAGAGGVRGRDGSRWGTADAILV